jgi:predicted TIM-barrel fold metal-dependent hydrolase
VTDNRITLDAIQQLDLANARGIAVVHPDVTDTELKALDAGGVRGIRFSVFDPRTAAVSIGMIEPLSKRVAALGWHVQLHMRGDQIAENADLLMRLPSSLVFDHLGRLPQPEGTSHAAFGIIARLIDKGQTWVKLSGAYLDTKAGPPHYADATAVAQAYVRIAPDRVVWGSDWPHPTENDKPDDAVLFDLLGAWAPDDTTRRKILVDNPTELYGFSE